MICCLISKSSLPPPGALEAVARLCSPRVMTCGRTAVLFDASGLTRAIGPPARIVDEVRRLAAAEGLTVRAAVAGTMSAAWLLAHASTPVVVIDPGREAAVLAPLPLILLKTLPGTSARAAGQRRAPRGHRPRHRHYRIAPGPAQPVGLAEGLSADETLSVLATWGLSTLGDLARLPRADVRTRLGETGARLHQAACGEDDAPLVPADAPPVFMSRMELEWPVEGLEPLSFVLARACESLSAELERADRGAIAILTRLHLVTRDTHARTLELPAPMRDGRVLRTLILLDLESHPPGAAIDAIEVELSVTPGRIEQGSLLERMLPSTEDISMLLARLTALAGAARVGAPVLVDSHDERAVAVAPFSPPRQPARRQAGPETEAHDVMLRRFRLPIVARVTVARGVPVRVEPAARGISGGRIVSSAGPWRSSGRWWALGEPAWDRDEWDVELEAGVCYRLARDRATGRWEIEGTVD